MANHENKTIVGIPFYDGEGIEVLATCLTNLDRCLNVLKLDAKIVVGINGPRVSMGQSPISYKIDRSKYNADINFIKTRPGLVAAEKAICSKAEVEGYQRIFLTDADISRLPMSLYHMWHQGDRPIVGANYATYPPEILNEAGTNLTPTEIAFMKIFEADKHPLTREFTRRYRQEKRLKGSLLLVNTEIGKTMFGNQGITTDSRMNGIVSDTDRQVIRNAGFMHYARVSLIDHIQGRLRHFRAAALESELDSFTRKSIIYNSKTADEIAQKILLKYPQAIDIASNFLLQCALRHQVAKICRAAASGNELPAFPNFSTNFDMTMPVHSFKEASIIIAHLLSQMNWANLDSPVTNGKGITQEFHRIPIDLEPFLKSEQHRKLILSHLGLDDKTEV